MQGTVFDVGEGGEERGKVMREGRWDCFPVYCVDHERLYHHGNTEHSHERDEEQEESKVDPQRRGGGGHHAHTQSRVCYWGRGRGESVRWWAGQR